MQRKPQEAVCARFDHWETGKVRRTMMQSRKTYRISCAGVLRPVGGASLSSASCDGQDGRLFSCEKAPSAVDGAFVYERTMKMGMCMEERTGGYIRAAGRKWT